MAILDVLDRVWSKISPTRVGAHVAPPFPVERRRAFLFVRLSESAILEDGEPMADEESSFQQSFGITVGVVAGLCVAFAVCCGVCGGLSAIGQSADTDDAATTDWESP